VGPASARGGEPGDPTTVIRELRVLGSLSNPLTAVHLKNLYFLEGGKTAGNSILIQYSSQCLIVDCQMESPSSGVRLHSVNTVEFERRL
jgi:hypothetical protein